MCEMSGTVAENEFGEPFQLVADPARRDLPPWDQWRANETTGKYATEDEAKADFIRHINGDHWFVDGEVDGSAVFPKQDCHSINVRADYILWPKQSLISQGWSVGPIVVEVKKSGHKLGPLITQALDYMRCQFRSGDKESPNYGVTVRPSFCIVFPLAKIQETLQSVMSHERIGHAHIGDDGRLLFYLNGKVVYTETGGVFLCDALRSGRKFGSK